MLVAQLPSFHAVCNNFEKSEFSDIFGNNESSIGGFRKFYEDSLHLSPMERAKVLEQQEDIRNVHASAALEGQTSAPTLEEAADVNLHFVSLVNKNNALWELDGCVHCPIYHRQTHEVTFVQVS